MTPLFFIISLSCCLTHFNIQSMDLRRIIPDQYPFLNQQEDVVFYDQLPVLMYAYVNEITNYTNNTLCVKHFYSRPLRLPPQCCTTVNLKLARMTSEDIHKTDIKIYGGNYRTRISCKNEAPTVLCISRTKKWPPKEYSFITSLESAVRETLSNGSLKPNAKIALALHVWIDQQENIGLTAHIGVKPEEINNTTTPSIYKRKNEI